MKKYRCQIDGETRIVNATGRHDAAAQLGFEITGVYMVNALASTYAVTRGGKAAVLTVSEMDE